jgi:8-oxo-dGTP pyrophosphatase MutT (NUDIX family)
MSAPGAEPHDEGANPAIPAATVVLLRDTSEGIETLMLRRNSKLDFAGGMWVWPGGRIDPEDYPADATDDHLVAARRAAVREANEEAGLVVDESSLVWFSHWTPPAISPKRFATWFFAAPAPTGEVVVDGGEIHEHQWIRPRRALELRNALEIELTPPTWITLEQLKDFADVGRAMAELADRQPEYFTTRIATVPGGGLAALYHGDAGYDSGDASALGRRHRLWMTDSGWWYERDS